MFAARTIRSMVWSILLGPCEQLAPTTATPSASRAADHRFRRFADDRGAFVGESEGNDDREVARRACGGQGRLGHVERGHGFDQKEVDSAFFEGDRLVGEGGDGVGERNVAQRFEGFAQRSDSAGHENAVARGLASDPGALSIDLGDLSVQAMRARA